MTYTRDRHTTQAGFGPELRERVARALAPDPSLVVRTGTYVVDPPFFGDGDIGRLAVCGAVNDLAATGAEPRHLALGFVLEAGLPLDLVHRLTASVRAAADEAGVAVAAVDTKVVRAGEADRVFVTATAFGERGGPPLELAAVRPGDSIVVTGPLGHHAAHLLSLRDGLGYEHHVPSDCAPLGCLLRTVRADIRHARPVADGGLAEVLRLSAGGRGLTLRVDEDALPVRYEARVALATRGLAPLDAACAGCLCLFVPPERTPRVLAALRGHRYGRHAAVVGQVTDDALGDVEFVTRDGVRPRAPSAGPLPERLL
ncbi:AIR synthase-related protein [Streptomyces sp. ITFR-16]|uniref:AIR synthase-related protein n=1 Tax=Streptomyces sp. ITFR-16 TaxID=3075198 RepID=UPI00288BA001|nr:AIR synthase-related protein [Streptomyces sp. ITFR-16]WNI23545.1 AIR synthase-related protein [Streptomyces sp. ITFR-16]